jgi:hypothetical protein
VGRGNSSTKETNSFIVSSYMKGKRNRYEENLKGKGIGQKQEERKCIARQIIIMMIII